MKNLLLLSLLFVVTVFSCSVEEQDTLETSDNLPILVLENDSATSGVASLRASTAENICSRELLLSLDNKKAGFVDISFSNNQVVVTYSLFQDAYLEKTNLSIRTNTTTYNFPTDANGNPSVENFEYRTTHDQTIQEYTYRIDQSFYGDIYAVAAHAVIGQPGKKSFEAWITGKQFTQETLACYAEVYPDNCGARYVTCVDQENIDMYIPLTSNTSGIYPESGSAPDQVTLTPSEPISKGTLDIAMNFKGLPKSFGDATISFTFDDLDLSTDYISISGNAIEFNETLELRDESGNVLATLDETHSNDGNFTWDFVVPNDVFLANNKDSITLYITLESNLALIDGNGVQVRNTIERILDISMCGSKMGGSE